MTEPIRVTLAEDDLLVRSGINALLDTVDDIAVVDLCTDLPGLLSAVKDQPPHVVVTDIRMPPTGENEGIAAAQFLADHHPSVGVIVLSNFVDPSLAMAVLGDGTRGRGYLLKPHIGDADRLADAIRAVAAGGSYIDTEVIEALVDGRKNGPADGLKKLSCRELEVLRQVAEGHNNQAIADALFIGKPTVEKHITSIFAKLGLGADSDAHRRVAAVLLYLAGEAHLS